MQWWYRRNGRRDLARRLVEGRGLARPGDREVRPVADDDGDLPQRPAGGAAARRDRRLADDVDVDAVAVAVGAGDGAAGVALVRQRGARTRAPGDERLTVR